MLILSDFSTSVRKAFEEIDPPWDTYPGLVVCGSHSPHEAEEIIDQIRVARETGLPFYGECYGHQLACIEWARNKMGMRDATSEEFGHGTFVVKKRPELKVGLHDGESWWSNYEVIEEVEKDFMEHHPPHMITAPFHPSYQSSKYRQHPLLVHFIEICRVYSNMLK